MTFVLTGPDGATVPFATATLDRSVEGGFSQLSVGSHTPLSSFVLRTFRATWEGALVFAGDLVDVGGNRVTGYRYAFRSLPGRLDRHDALGVENFRDAPLRSILRAVARRADVEVGVAPAQRVKRFRLQRGQTLREQLQRLVAPTKHVLTDDAAGRIRAFALDGAQAPRERWRVGQGIVTSRVALNINARDLRDRYLCRGQRVILASDLDAEFALSYSVDVEVPLPGGQPIRTQRVMSNRGAASRDEAIALVRWTARAALARAFQTPLTLSQYPGDPGFLVQLEDREGSDPIQQIAVVSRVRADFVRQAFQVMLSAPEAYLRRGRLPRIADAVEGFAA